MAYIIENPVLMQEWDFEKNTELRFDASTITTGSRKKVWWKCSKEHSWVAPVYSRANGGSGCPFCSGRNVICGETDLATTNPSIAAEWHPTKNHGLTPQEVKAGTGKKAWWVCSVCKHEWQAVISSRGISGHGCPECQKQKISLSRMRPKKGESLLEKYPEIAKEWNYDKNTINPADIKARSSQIVWWKCKNGHEWQASLGNRTGGRDCPICGHKKVEAGFNDLATANPDLAKEWHPTKNGGLFASDVTPSSSKRVWWKCATCGHEWSATVNNRTKRGCPKCSNGLQVSFPEKAIAFYLRYIGLLIEENYRPAWLKRKELDIYIPSLQLGVEYDGEQWHQNGRIDINKELLCLENGVGLIRVREPNCPKIIGLSDCHVLADRNEKSLNAAIRYIYDVLQEKYHVSIPSDCIVDVEANRTEIYELMELGKKPDSITQSHPQLASEWHPTKNGTLTPDMVTKGSDIIVWWRCKNGHTWDASVSHRASGRGCPVCSGKRIIEGENDICTLFPDILSEWNYDKNLNIDPKKCGKSDLLKAWWKCNVCGHEWNTSIASRIGGSTCPCCLAKHLSNVNSKPKDGNSLLDKNPDLAIQWHPTRNGTLLPSDVSAGSHKRVWWMCSNGHEWESIINSRNHGSGCPYCAHKK